MADIRGLAEEWVVFSFDSIEKIKREMLDKIPESDDEVRFRKQQEKLRRIYSNRRK